MYNNYRSKGFQLAGMSPEEMVLADKSTPWSTKTKLRIMRTLKGLITNVWLMIATFGIFIALAIVYFTFLIGISSMGE